MFYKIIATNQPTRLIYHITCEIHYAHDVAGVIREVAALSTYEHIRIVRMQ
jgi:hypothetical protein